MPETFDFPYVPNRFSPVRRETVQVHVGDALIGGGAPILVQSMTTTKPKDIDKTVQETLALANAGCELVRITAPTFADAQALKDVMQKIRLFESIYLDDCQLFQDDDCKRWLEPYLPYILEMIGGLQLEYLPRLHDIFAKVSMILAARKQDAARKNNEEKEITLQVLEAELADIIKDTNLFRQIGHK